MPAATPVTRPVVEFTVAWAIALLVHVPPAVASLKAEVKPTHTFEVPVMAEGVVLTVIRVVAIQPVGNV